MSDLDVIGALTGTDKSSSVSWAWDYLRHYEDLFSRWRHADINMIEIGVASGSSLAAWLRYFDKAQLVGIDVNPECRRYAQDRVTIRIGSQEDPGFLHGVAAEFPPTIVIDDGSHVAHHMIASFEALFPALRAGGLYIFEDMAFHFNESARRFQDARAHQGLAEMPIFDYLNKFIRARAASVSIPEGSWGFARYAFENIDSITVAGGFIAVRKTARRDFDHAIASFERELSDGRYERNAMAFRYAEYLLKHGQNPERAAALLTDVTAAEPGNEPALVMLLDVLLRIDAVDQAADVATRLVNIDPSNAIYWDRLAGLERRCNRPELEASALRRLIELQPKSAGHHLRLSEISEDMGDRRAALELARGASALEPDNVDFRNRVSALESNLS